MVLPMLMRIPGDEKEEKTLLRFFFVFVILVSIQLANAQDDQVDLSSSNVKPSLFVVVGVLSFMGSLTFLFLMYTRMCYREPTSFNLQDRNRNHNHLNRGMFGIHTRFSGLDIELVESLPFFRFSSLKGAKQGLQCSVCLTEFEDIEILRLLPKCKHGFHIECIDKWLEKHSTCPLCRQKVTKEDLTLLVNSSSMRLIIEGRPDSREASSNFEIFIEREDDGQHQRSSRFAIGDSFRRIFNPNKEDHLPNLDVEASNLHRLNHQIMVSDVVFKNRWSDVRSSDLMFLNSEMLGLTSSDRFSSSNRLAAKYDSKDFEGSSDNYNITNIKEEMERKRMFEHKIGQVNSSTSNPTSNTDMGFDNSREISMISSDRRAMSEITALSRFSDFKSMKNKLRQSLRDEENEDESVRNDIIKRRRKWLHIAKRTVQWFANRENNNRSQQQQQQLQSHDIGHTLDV